MPSTEPIRFTDGSAYGRFMALWSRSAGALFLDWSAPAPGQAWAEIGCGNGAFTELIFDKVAPSSICGIDPSDAQITFARQKVSGKPVEFAVGHVLALPYANARFEVTVMALVLFFVPDRFRSGRQLPDPSRRRSRFVHWPVANG